MDPVKSHLEWCKDIEEFGNLEGEVPYPILADVDGEVASKFGMLDRCLPTIKEGKRIIHATVRTCLLIDPSKKLRCLWAYPPQLGRNTDEIMRALKALQKVDAYTIVTPVNWSLPGCEDRVIIPPCISDEEAEKKYSVVEYSKFPYLRYTKLIIKSA